MVQLLHYSVVSFPVAPFRDLFFTTFSFNWLPQRHSTLSAGSSLVRVPISDREKEFKSSEELQLNNTKGKKKNTIKNPSMVDFYPCTDYKALYCHGRCVQYRCI